MKIIFQKFKNGIVKTSKSLIKARKARINKKAKYQALKLEKQKRKNLEKSLNLKKNLAYVNSNVNNVQIDYLSNKYNKRTSSNNSNNSKMFDFKGIDSFINTYLCNQSFKLNFINVLILSLMAVLVLLNYGIE